MSDLAQITIKLPQPMRSELERVAERERRTVSNMVRVILEDALAQHGHDDDGARQSQHHEAA